MLTQERIDFGFAYLASLLAGGQSSVKDHLPPWYDTADTEDSMLASMLALKDRFAKEE